jgi:K+/H+ antiporter YhaU regulatory subunit KhtT
MGRSDLSRIPRYQQIAIEIAARIVNGKLSEGDRISGRSSVAGQFNVSPETARRAFSILADLEIISPEKGKGMRVLSQERARTFLAQFSNQKDLESIRTEISQSIQRQMKEINQMNEMLSELIGATDHYRSMNPLAPYAIHITALCRFLGKTVQDVRFWQNTGATVVAVRRNNTLLISPGPYIEIRENDILYFVTAEMSDQKIKDFLYHA